ncbi:hypothetical protein BDV23DRAFT_149128 [Aspergillus alliaceus]|uniref:Ankyrin repeat-containing domain protein n=1 Tax=Petromyces alliaceus TaxID=209559 RepID=A0A5N7CI34_PETAA|nr:hypothetical protein BDV23DRAFT_149128 [Aspergillus alliaceus]
MVQVLLDSSVDSDQKDIFGRSPMNWAAEYGHTNVVRALVEYGADPDCVDDDHHIVEGRTRREGLCLVPLFFMNHK